MSEYRHEYKYLCTEQQIMDLRLSLETVMDYDSSIETWCGYTARSVYFDDYNDQAFYDNINGIDPREKYRMRIYNANLSTIRLECKQKRNGKTRKVSCLLPQETCEDVLRGQYVDIRAIDNPVYKRFSILQHTHMLAPKIIVEYDRIPFVCKEGNVRVTFDMNIRSSVDVEHFLEKDISYRPIMEKGKHIMEVKFDEFIPDYIYHVCNIKSLQRTAFSKYCLCRRYK